MKQNHSATLAPKTGDVWPCQIVASGNPALPTRDPNGLRWSVVYPDGQTSLAYYRQFTAIQLARAYNEEYGYAHQKS